VRCLYLACGSRRSFIFPLLDKTCQSCIKWRLRSSVVWDTAMVISQTKACVMSSDRLFRTLDIGASYSSFKVQRHEVSPECSEPQISTEHVVALQTPSTYYCVQDLDWRRSDSCVLQCGSVSDRNLTSHSVTRSCVWRSARDRPVSAAVVRDATQDRRSVVRALVSDPHGLCRNDISRSCIRGRHTSKFSSIVGLFLGAQSAFNSTDWFPQAFIRCKALRRGPTTLCSAPCPFRKSSYLVLAPGAKSIALETLAGRLNMLACAESHDPG
jgi:hypothetical protein